jgi:hypothetical protein
MAGTTPKGPRKPQGTNWRQVVDDYKQKVDGAAGGAIRLPIPQIEGAVVDKLGAPDERLDEAVVSVASVKPQDAPNLKFLEEALSSDLYRTSHRNADSLNGNRTPVTPWYQLNRKRFDEGSPADQNSPGYRNEDAMVSPVSLRKFQDPPDRNHLDGIATLVLALTYGEMIELANGIWKAQPEGSAITQDNLSALLHRWSKSHAAAGNKADPEAGSP